MKWSIYVLKHPRTGEVRYVGWTIKDPAKRLKVHLQDAMKHRTHKQRWIFSLLSIGLIPEVAVIETGTGDLWAAAECRWIAYYRAQGVRLVNGTDGGQGVVGEPPEKRHARGRKIAAWWASLSVEERRARAVSPHEIVANGEGWSVVNKRNWAKRTGEQRFEPSRRGNAKIPLEQHRATLAKARAAITFEIRSAASTKSWNRPSVERRQRIKDAGDMYRANMSPAEILKRADNMRRANNIRWAATKAEAAAGAALQESPF